MARSIHINAAYSYAISWGYHAKAYVIDASGLKHQLRTGSGETAEQAIANAVKSITDDYRRDGIDVDPIVSQRGRKSRLSLDHFAF